MKTDVLTIAVLIFCVGVLITSVGSVFDSEPERPQSELQQGVAASR